MLSMPIVTLMVIFMFTLTFVLKLFEDKITIVLSVYKLLDKIEKKLNWKLISLSIEENPHLPVLFFD